MSDAASETGSPQLKAQRGGGAAASNSRVGSRFRWQLHSLGGAASRVVSSSSVSISGPHEGLEYP